VVGADEGGSGRGGLEEEGRGRGVIGGRLHGLDYSWWAAAVPIGISGHQRRRGSRESDEVLALFAAVMVGSVLRRGAWARSCRELQLYHCQFRVEVKFDVF
jgi:hypothetical protein